MRALGLAAGFVKLFLRKVDDAVDKGLARVALPLGFDGLKLFLLAVLPDDGDGYVGQGYQRQAQGQRQKRAQDAAEMMPHANRPPTWLLMIRMHCTQNRGKSKPLQKGVAKVGDE